MGVPLVAPGGNTIWPETKMRLTIILGFLSGGALAAGACSWYLEADDCICMNSTNGELLRKQTATICKSMGYQLWGDVRISHCSLAALED